MPRNASVSAGLRIRYAQKLLLLTSFALIGFSGCNGPTTNNGGGSQAISVSVSATVTTLSGGGTDKVTATVTGDSSNAGVTWAAPSIGSLSSLTSLTPTYTAPAATASAQHVTLTATSVADTSKSASITLTINPQVTVAVSAPATTLDGNDAGHGDCCVDQ